MIIKEPEQVTRELQSNWIGREVRITKTEPIPPVQFTLGEARVVDWHEIGHAIRERLPENTQFIFLSGEGDQVYQLLIPLDQETVYDVRKNRLVLLTEKEVIQVTPVS